MAFLLSSLVVVKAFFFRYSTREISCTLPVLVDSFSGAAAAAEVRRSRAVASQLLNTKTFSTQGHHFLMAAAAAFLPRRLHEHGNQL